jgi:Icc-related predicted phosphoesterase
MRLLLVGDSHGDLLFIERIERFALSQQVDKIIYLGDFGYWPGYNDDFICRDWQLSTYFLDGNHENHSKLNHAAKEFVPITSNLFYLPRGFSWEWNNVRFLSLGGAYSIDRFQRTVNVDWFVDEVISEEDVNRACNNKPVDIMLTHDSPYGVNIGQYGSSLESDINRKHINTVLKALKPKELYHGHFHIRHETLLEGYDHSPCLVNGLGFNKGNFEDSYLIKDIQ